MSTTLIYACDVDHHSPERWSAWLERAHLDLNCYHLSTYQYKPPFKVELKEEAVFRYGKRKPMASLSEELYVEGNVVSIRKWSTIVFYSAVAVTIGDLLDVREIKDCFRHHLLLNEYQHGFEYKKVKLIGVNCGEEELTKVGEHISRHREFVLITNQEPQDRRLIIQQELTPAAGDVFVVEPINVASTEWRYPDSSFIAISRHSPFIDAIVSAFGELEDMTLFLGKWKLREPIMTYGQNHADDLFLCTYNLNLIDATCDNVAFLI